MSHLALMIHKIPMLLPRLINFIQQRVSLITRPIPLGSQGRLTSYYYGPVRIVGSPAPGFFSFEYNCHDYLSGVFNQSGAGFGLSPITYFHFRSDGQMGQLTSLGLKEIRRSTRIIPLCKSFRSLFGSFKGVIRTEYRKALRRGWKVRVIRINNVNRNVFLKNYYGLYSRRNDYCKHNVSHIDDLLNNQSKERRVAFELINFLNGTHGGYVVITVRGECAQYSCSALNNSFASDGINTLALVHAMRTLTRFGVKYFDMGGVNNDSIGRYKSTFGGVESTYFEYWGIFSWIKLLKIRYF